MMKLFLAALLIWSFSVVGESCGSARVQEQARPQEPARPSPTEELALTPPIAPTATLTNEHPTAMFAAYPDLNDPPTVLEVSVTKVINPGLKPITIFVYLSPVSEKADATPAKFAVGNFSLYPADKPAKFMLDPATAFRKAAETKDAANTKEWLVTYELEKRADQEPTQVEVTIAPLWKRDKN
jgi:hypothetical protein